MLTNQVLRIWLSLCSLCLVSLACNLPGKEASSPTASLAKIPAITEASKLPLPSETSEAEPALVTPDINELTVAYTSAQDLFLFSEGKSARLTNSGDVFQPRISPDGQMIAYLKPVNDFHLEIWCIDQNGTNERSLVSMADMDRIAGGFRDSAAVAINPFSDYSWIPGTKIVAFTSQQIYQGPGANMLNDLTLVNAESGEVSSLFLSGWGGEFVFSPDGSQVAISQPDRILLADVDGSNYRTALTYEPVTTYSEYRFFAKPIWALDGSYLMVAIPPVDPLEMPVQETELWKLHTDGAPAALLGSVKSVPFMESAVQFSPDLKWIAYISGNFDSNYREIHLAATDGSKVRKVDQAAPLSFLSWAPDSLHFAYSVNQEVETMIASLADALAVKKLNLKAVRSLTWVDESSFLFWIPSEEAFELWFGNLKGGTILLDRIFENPPAFSIWRG